jgi:hypothetical protein
LTALSYQNSVRRQIKNQSGSDQLDSKINNTQNQSLKLNDLLNSNNVSIEFEDNNNNNKDDEDIDSYLVDSIKRLKDKENSENSKKSPASFGKDIQKSVKINCLLDNFHFHMVIDFDKINEALNSKLKLDETDVIKGECFAKQNSFIIILNDAWSLFLNFTLIDQSNHDFNHKQFKLNQVKLNVDKDENIYNGENLTNIIRGHQSSIECSNSREINTISSVIINLENYKIETLVTCVKKVTPLVRMGKILNNLSFYFFRVIFLLQINFQL